MNNKDIIDLNSFESGFLIYNEENIIPCKFLGKNSNYIGEICFNTSMTGYQEICSDPSYTGQIITFSFPLVGIVGTNEEDLESSQMFAKGVVIRDIINGDYNWRSTKKFINWVYDQNKFLIKDIDTRSLITLIRKNGPKNILICNSSFFKSHSKNELFKLLNDEKSLEEKNVINEYYQLNKSSHNISSELKHKIAFLDFGAKNNIKKNLIKQGCYLNEFQSNFSASEILNNEYKGVFLSNGPGDPKKVFNEIKNELYKLISSNIPIFGICLGHQLLSLAFGMETIRMKQGHRGGNHPVKNIKKNKVEITSQNHGFVVSGEKIPENIEITHISLFDKSIDGMRVKDKKIFSVQYHPESSPGPHDSRYLFDDFLNSFK